MSSELALYCEHLGYQIQGHALFDTLSFGLEAGEIGAIIGPSGEGKSTLLRLILGLQTCQSGQIYQSGQCLSGPGTHVRPQDRHMAVVFQEWCLFGHLNVRENICFAIRTRSSVEQSRLSQDYVALLSLGPLLAKYPHELSGGEQQRVAIARALVSDAGLLVLDEPFSSIDPAHCQTLLPALRARLKERKQTTLLVTHHQDEAFGFCDKVGLLMKGQIQQWGSPQSLYREPKNRMVAEFIGDGTWIRDHSGSSERFYRPDELYLTSASQGRPGRVDRIEQRVGSRLITVILDTGESCRLQVSDTDPIEVGAVVGVGLADGAGCVLQDGC